MTVIDALDDVRPIDFGGPLPLAGALGSAGRGDRLVVLYDRDCGLCTAAARALRRWDRKDRLDLLPLQDAARSEHPAIAHVRRDLPLAAALHVVDPRTGTVRAGGDAVLVIGAALPGGIVVRPFAAIPALRWIVGLTYRLVARHRHRIGRWLRLEGPACAVPR